jgi:hypothetical protein
MTAFYRLLVIAGSFQIRLLRADRGHSPDFGRPKHAITVITRSQLACRSRDCHRANLERRVSIRSLNHRQGKCRLARSSPFTEVSRTDA